MAESRKTCLLLPILLAALGCASTGNRSAVDAGTKRTVVTGQEFEHAIISQYLSPDVRTLHLYIGGDGRAFITPRRIALDPTPSRSLTLALMQSDPNPAIYIGRPCYHGLAESENCSPRRWTIERYSEATMRSMTSVIRDLIDRYPHAKIRIFGYSGGGVIALLAGSRVLRVETVVTVAAPLDTEAWTRFHGYTPLYGSINPVEVEHWPPTLQQLHLSGTLDREVPPDTTTTFRERFESSQVEFRRLEGFDHNCCWPEYWPSMLLELSNQTKAQSDHP